MDNSRIVEIIPIAFKQKLLKPSREGNICFTPSLNQANFLLWILSSAGESGLSTSQIEKRSGLHLNTCKVYLREFVKIGLVDRERRHQQEAIWCYKEKHK